MKTFRFTLLSILILLTGCLALKPLHPVDLKPGNTLLYVTREDSAISMSDRVVVFLNQKEAAEILEYDGYKAFILKPGKYTIQFDVYNDKNELIKRKDFSDTLKADKSYMCGIAYNFGWRGFDTFFNADGKSVFARFKFMGEVDMTDKVDPQ